MQFKNPEILYFLFALVLPILVHLFQLKKFNPQVFTNVAFLKEISLQTRKSSQLKKWLLLVCRLFLLACLIIAFAQPYFPAKQQNLTTNSLVIALDNSFSMQAKGQKGPLLSTAIQEILEFLPKKQTFTLVTNNTIYWDINIETAQNELQNISYTSIPFNLNNLQHQISNKFAKNTYDLLVVTDAIHNSDSIKSAASQNFIYTLTPVNKQNAAIITANINNNNTNFNELEIELQGYSIKDSVLTTLSVFDDSKMYSKSKIYVKDGANKIAVNLPKESIQGKVTIDTPDLDYDNEYFFSLQTPKHTKIGIIGESIPELIKIISEQNASIQYINSGTDFSNFHTVWVNQETKNLNSLSEKLKKAYNEGTNIIFTPNVDDAIENQNQLLSHFGALKFSSLKTNKNSITTIHNAHPIYKNVFGKTPEHFEFPSTNKNFVINGTLAPILSYANQEIYLGQTSNGQANLYLFASGLQPNQTNITQAPIIVPTLYNMLMQNQTNQFNNFEIGMGNHFLVDVLTANVEPLLLEGKHQQGIAQQQPVGTKAKLIFDEFPTVADNYLVKQDKNIITTISTNYPRTESDLTLNTADLFNNFVKINSIDEALNKINENRLGTELWKYFLFTTLLFLILELLIQKFVK